MYLEKSRGCGLRIGVALCRPCTLYNPAHHSISHLKIGCRHPIRKPLQFIVIAVMSVMSGTFPHTYRGFLRDDQFLACSGTVTSSSW
jgi:hypothetical protein